MEPLFVYRRILLRSRLLRRGPIAVHSRQPSWDNVGQRGFHLLSGNWKERQQDRSISFKRAEQRIVFTMEKVDAGAIDEKDHVELNSLPFFPALRHRHVFVGIPLNPECKKTVMNAVSNHGHIESLIPGQSKCSGHSDVCIAAPCNQCLALSCCSNALRSNSYCSCSQMYLALPALPVQGDFLDV